jgi:hypothetical protein
VLYLAYIAVAGTLVAIPSIAATPSSLFSIPSIEAVRAALLVRPSGRTSASTAIFPLADTVDISATGTLLSSASEIADAARAAEQGAVIDSASLVENVQSFVDSVNAVSLSNEFVLSGLIDTSIVPAPGTAQANALGAVGINVLSLGSGSDSFILGLDIKVLEDALLTDPTGTSGQLAAATGTISAAAANQAGVATEVAAGTTQETLALAAAGQSANGLLTPEFITGAATAIDSVRSVVPDLTIENADLRRTLADRILRDIVDTATSSDVSTVTNETQLTALLEENALTASSALTTPPLVAAAPALPTATETPALALAQTQTLTLAANAITAPVVATPVLPANVTSEAQAQTALTLSSFLSTPLEDNARLAVSAPLGGAVGAFQIPVDAGNWGARFGIRGDLDVINPMAAVLQTKAIASNLASSSNERQENSAGSRLDQWLSGRIARRAAVRAVP